MFYLSGNTVSGVWYGDWDKVLDLLYTGNGKRACAVSDFSLYVDYYRILDVYDWIAGGCSGSESKDFTGDAVSGEKDGV